MGLGGMSCEETLKRLGLPGLEGRRPQGLPAAPWGSGWTSRKIVLLWGLRHWDRFLERGLMPPTWQCSAGLWLMPFWTHFNFWLGLKCSGSWIWWSLKVPSDWTILIQWPNHVISQFSPAIIELCSKVIWINENTAAPQHFEWDSLTSSDPPLFPMTTGYGKKQWELGARRSRQAAQQVAESGEGLGFANH